MESTAVLRSFQHSIGNSQLKSILDMPGVVPMNNVAFSNSSSLRFGQKLICLKNRRHKRLGISYAKASESTGTSNFNGAAISPQSVANEKSPLPRTTFPDGFQALITEVCDDTEIAELKLKAGDFEIHMKRKIELTTFPAPVVSPPPPPPSPSKPVLDSLPAASSASPSKPSEKSSPFINACAEKAAKLAALEASGASGYVLVSSQAVGSFRRARPGKGMKPPPACKEGDMIKEGQTIGFLDQFGTVFPIKADVAGKVLKVLYNDGEPVGYGDPLLAVQP